LFHSIFLDITGHHIYTCGRCDSGQLGLQESYYVPGDFRNRLQKVLFDEADPEEDLDFQSIAAGENSSFAATRTGKLYSWGFGDMGQLGHGKEVDQLQATPIQNFVKVGFALEVSSGSQHTIVLANTDMLKKRTN
jgi:regulator of chromosome condensation